MVDLGCVFARFFIGTIVGLTRMVRALIGTRATLTAVDGPLLAKLLAGSLPGIWLGSRLTHHTPDRVIRSLLSVLLAWAGTKLVLI